MLGIVNAQLETPNSFVRKQLRKFATEETGASISDALIEQALHSLNPAPPIVKANAATSASISPPPAPKPTTPTVQTFYPFAEVAADTRIGTGKKPSLLQFESEKPIAVTTWADVAIKTLERVGEQFALPPLPFSNRAKGKTYFLNTQPTHSTGQPMKGHRSTQVNGSIIYMDTNRSMQEIMNSLLILFAAMKVPQDFVRVSIG